jgi:uncharacterized protein YhaN
MRIRSLKLVRYGRFTDCALDFAAPGVHVVVGPNEAGKSTLRSSVGELLYGIHPQTKLDFLHPMQDLRIDAELEGTDGTVLEVVRLKKNKDPLRTPEDRPLPQGAVDRLLAGVDKDDFRTVFALDHEELRAGGRALLEGKGDLGEALFESRSSARLTRIQEQLREQYKALYTARGKNQPLNLLLGASGRVVQAKRERDGALLDPREYQRIRDAAEQARTDLAKLTASLRREQTELNRMRRIRQAYATVGERTRLTRDRAALLAQGVAAPAHAQETYAELDKERRALTESEGSSHGELEKVEAQLAEVQSRAEAVGVLAGEGASSGPEYVARLEDLLVRVEELRDTGREADIRWDEAKKTVLKRRQDLARLESALAELTEPMDATALRAGLKAVPEGLSARVESLRRQAEAARAKLATARSRYARFELPEELGELALPGERELAAQLKRINEADARLAEATRRQAEESAREREQRRALESFLAQDPPPSEEELEQIRIRRQELWKRLRPSLTDVAAVPSAELVLEYEAAVAAGDETADRMRREAQRLAQRRGLELAVRESADRVAELGEAVTAARDARAELGAAWEALWRESGLVTPPPDAADDLMRALAELRELAETSAEQQLDLAADEAAARSHAARLRVLLAESGAAEPARDLSLRELRELADQRATRLDEAAREHAAAIEKVNDARAELGEAEREEGETALFVAGLKRAWDELTAAHGLEGTPDLVKSSLERMLRVEEDRSRLRIQQDHLRTAVRKNQEQQERVRADIARLLGECGVASEEELREAIARGTQLRRIDDNLDLLLTALSGQGLSVEQLEREVAEHDVDELDARLAEWERRVEELDAARGEKNTELAEREHELRRMNGSATAAEKAEAVEQELASVVAYGQDYLRLYLAERLLLENIETYRRDHQGPVLGRAQQLFADLTGGRFVHLVDDTGPDGRTVLRARRAVEDATAGVDGQLVGVEGMSEGTRDQLYLALRLATLERYADEGRAMPLLLDDVLMTFDDTRAAAALRVFDDLAERFQVILLTHHVHLVEVAAAVLPEQRLHVHRVG